MYAPTLVTAPTETPISLDEAKVNCSVDAEITDWDALITGLIEAATSLLDGYPGILGRCLVTQTWQVTADDLDRCMRLPMPASAVVVKVRNSAGQLATVTSTNYSLLADARGSYVRFKDAYAYPGDLAETEAVILEFTAGYGAAADVPAAIKQAMHLLVGHWFANREAAAPTSFDELPLGPKALLTPFRRIGV